MLLPAYNEEGNVTPVIEELMAVIRESKLDVSVIAVDDGSCDRTLEMLTRLAGAYDKLEVVDHGENRGFACAVRTGIQHALERGFDAIVLMDCDQSHDPRDLPRLIGGLERGYDIVLGSRYVSGGGMLGVPIWRVAISRIGNLVGRRILGLPVRDLTTGYRAIRREVLRGLELREDGFTIQLETVVKAHMAGYSLGEVPSVLRGRQIGRSKMRYDYELLKYCRLLRTYRRWIRKARA